MEISPQQLSKALAALLAVEREHQFGVKTGSPTARKKELERELDRVITELNREVKK